MKNVTWEVDMIELPEAITISEQISQNISGRRIASVIAGFTPHKLAWFYGDKEGYSALLCGKTIEKADSFGGFVQIKAANIDILFNDGIIARMHKKGEPRPSRHQLLIEFEDGCALSLVVQMYGGMGSFPDGELDNVYYRVAREKPSPLSAAFDKEYFDALISVPELQKLSLKALIATEQRIPGLGNGVLQDILFNAKMHPKKKTNTLSAADKEALFNSIKNTLGAMVKAGGRDTEADIFGNAGGYKSILSKNTAGKPCSVCGTLIKKEAYLGGSIYYCEKCQLL
jgi:formamidopyrimidine-DNA glycosylase